MLSILFKLSFVYARPSPGIKAIVHWPYLIASSVSYMLQPRCPRQGWLGAVQQIYNMIQISFDQCWSSELYNNQLMFYQPILLLGLDLYTSEKTRESLKNSDEKIIYASIINNDCRHCRHQRSIKMLNNKHALLLSCLKQKCFF